MLVPTLVSAAPIQHIQYSRARLSIHTLAMALLEKLDMLVLWLQVGAFVE